MKYDIFMHLIMIWKVQYLDRLSVSLYVIPSHLLSKWNTVDGLIFVEYQFLVRSDYSPENYCHIPGVVVVVVVVVIVRRQKH